jgi:hypothetical protein
LADSILVRLARQVPYIIHSITGNATAIQLELQTAKNKEDCGETTFIFHFFPLSLK